MNLIQSLVETTLFYHPAVWWVSRQIRIEREFCTDDIAHQVCSGKDIYVKALVRIAEIIIAKPQHALAISDGNLTNRVQRLLRTPVRRQPASWPRRSVFVSLAATVILALSLSGYANQGGDDDINQEAASKTTPPAKAKADDALDPQSLEAVIKSLNEQAKSHPESRSSKPLNKTHVLQAIRAIKTKPAELSDEEYRTLQAVLENNRLGTNLQLRQFVRYGSDAEMKHGRWVRLVLDRDRQAPFVIPVTNETVATRPLTLLERADREAIRAAGGATLLNRFVSYFPKSLAFEKTTASVDYQPLIEGSQKAINDNNLDAFLKLYFWRGVHRNDSIRKFARKEFATLLARGVKSIEFEPKQYQGELHQQRSFYTYGPNTPVEGYLRFTFTKPLPLQPASLALEVGAANGKPRFVAYAVRSDSTKEFLGKRLSGSATIGGGFNTSLDKDWFESAVKITAPRELVHLEQANFELWRLPLRQPSRATEALKAILGHPNGGAGGAQPVTKSPEDNRAATIIRRLKQTEGKIRNLSVTTKYVKHQLSFLPVEKPVRMTLETKSIVESNGRAWNETRGQQVNIEPDGKSVRLYDGHWQSAFDGKTARALQGTHSASYSDHISWHGINPQLFTTHYFNRPVSELLEEKGAHFVKTAEWDGRQVFVVDTTVTKANRKYRFWVDPERRIVVRRAALVRYKDEQPFQEYTRIESTKHQLIDGVWLPSKVKYESVEVTPEMTPEKLSWRYEGENSDWKVNQDYDDTQFVIEFPKGAFVNDHRRPKPKEGDKPRTPKKD